MSINDVSKINNSIPVQNGNVVVKTTKSNYAVINNSFGDVALSGIESDVTSKTQGAENVLILGKQDGGDNQAIAITPEGHIEVAIHAPRLPFGSIHAEKLLPIFQADSIYGINPFECVSTTGRSITTGSTSATVTGSDNLFKCSTGATSYSFSSLQSRKRLRYRPGQGVIGRFSAIFSQSVDSSILVAGCGTAESGYYFGYYNGIPYAPDYVAGGTTEFGILYARGGNREIQTLTVTVASNGTGDITVVLPSGDGLTTSTVVTGITNAAASTVLTAYQISKGTFTGWKAEQIGSTVVFLSDSVGTKTGTASISQAGGGTAAGTFAETLAGSLGVDTFIPQSEWNGDKLDGTGPSGVTLNPQKGNVYQIDIQYLGFGAISFKVEITSTNNNNPDFVTVHTIKNPNTRTTPSVTQPSFPFTMAAYSAGSTTDVSVSVGSYAGFVEGDKYLNGPRLSYINTASSSTSAYTPLFTIRNSETHSHGALAIKANQSVINVLSVSGATKSTNGLTTFYILRNATLSAGTPNFARYSTISCAYYDTGATACTFSSNDQVLWSGSVSESGQFLFSFSDDITVEPGETITLAVRSVTATAVCVGQLNTREDQ